MRAWRHGRGSPRPPSTSSAPCRKQCDNSRECLSCHDTALQGPTRAISASVWYLGYLHRVDFDVEGSSHLILVLLAPVVPRRLAGSKMLGKGAVTPGMFWASATPLHSQDRSTYAQSCSMTCSTAACRASLALPNIILCDACMSLIGAKIPDTQPAQASIP